MTGAARAAVLVSLMWASVATPARAGYGPMNLALPDLDYAIGVAAGVGFGERAGERFSHPLVGLEASFLHHLVGVHAALRTHEEGDAWRVGGLAEVTIWYLVMAGVGVSAGWMVDDGGKGVPDGVFAVHAFLGIPFPLWTVAEPEPLGTMVATPYARAALRILDEDQVGGFFEVGVRLQWTSFVFGF